MKKTVVLTHEQAIVLRMYILMTHEVRKDEAESWDEIAKDTNEDGTPKYKAAASNAEWWRKADCTLEEIAEIIDSARLED